MKYLIKSSFKSFFQHKFAIILLSIIVFITSAAFTMFQSTSNAFNRSYNNVVTQGNLHDFTIKEKYPEANEIYLDDPKLTSTEHIQKTFSNTNASNVLTDNQKNIFITEKFKIGFFDGLALVNIKDIQDNQTTLKAKLVYSARTWGGKDFRGFSLNDHDNKENLLKMLDDPSLSFNTHNSETIIVKDFVLNQSDKNITIDHSGKSKVIPFNFDSFYNVVKTSKDTSFRTIDGDFNHYSYEISSLSSNEAKTAFSSLTDKDWSSIGDLPSNDFIVDKKYEGDPDEMDHAMSSNFKAYDYKAGSTLLKALLVKNIGSDLSKQMKDSVLEPYVKNGTISYKDVKSLYVTSNKEAFRFVNEREFSPSVDKLKLFSGFGLPKQEDPSLMKKRLQDKNPAINDNNTVDKGYSMVANWQESLFFGMFHIPHAANVLDLSSFAAVVSPSYASSNGKKALNESKYNEITSKLKLVLDDANHTFADVEAILKPYEDNVIWAQSTPYLITGVGITPDFSYPIVDASNPIPDSDNQAIIYTNGNGYNRIHDAFRGNSTENYIAVKVNKGNSVDVKNKINEELKKLMNWPNGIEPARMVNDVNEKVILAPQRITFLQTIKNTVSTISWVTILLMILFTAFIVGLVVKKKIATRTKQLAILMANGYTKLQIAISMMVIGLIVGSASTALGYIVGHSLQFAFISIFKNYWTLPIWETQFSWLSLVVTVIIPILGISLLAFFISLWQLRGSLIDKLNGSSSKTKGTFSNALVKAASFVGIKSKIAVSIFATNVSKMVMAIVAFSMTIIVGALTFNTFGKFDYALDQSENKVKYDFQVDLASPTSESGEYKLLNLDNMFQDKNGSSIDLDNIYIPIDNHTKDKPLDVKDMFYTISDGHHQDHPFPHVPTKGDSEGQEKDAMYLKNRIQFKSLLNPFMGALGSGVSPWSIANKMMPENQKNQADKRFSTFINYTKDVAEKSNLAYTFMSQAWYDKLKKTGTVDSKDISGIVVDQTYLDFIALGLKTSIHSYVKDGNRSVPLPFFLTYGNVLADKDDETYTYIDSTNVYKNFNGKTVKEDLIVRGIDGDSTNIILSDSTKKLLEGSETDFKNNNLVDIVVNKYFAKTHEVSIGDTFKSSINNGADRSTGVVGSTLATDVTYKVVAIQNSFDEGRVFTSQTVAREALGWGTSSTMFNGLFSKHSDELLFQNLPLYSPSGIYAGSDTFGLTPTTPADKAVDSFIKTGKFPNTNIKTYNDYIIHYGKSPMVMAYSSVDWATATDFKFHSVLKLSSSLLWMIQSITLFIALLFVALISSMIISDNKKFISTLKVLGYRTGEISKIFITTFIPSLLVAVAISIPIAFGILAGIQAALIGFGHVLIPLNIVGWEIVASTAMLVLGFLIVYWASSRELKNTSILNAFD